jgi:hypothetical protein
MGFKDKVRQKAVELDYATSAAMDIGKERVASWLRNYTVFIGLLLLIGIVVSVSLREWTMALIMFCTLHLQIVFRYSFRTANNIDLWTNKPQAQNEEAQTNSKNGSPPKPASEQ